MMMYKKYLLYALLLFVGCIILSKVSYFFVKKDEPKFFEEYIDKVKTDQHIMNEIGGFQDYEFSFNENDLSADTLRFNIKIIGNENTLSYKGFAVKDSLSKEFKIATINKE